MGEKRASDFMESRDIDDILEDAKSMEDDILNAPNEREVSAPKTAVLAQFWSEGGDCAGPPIELPLMLSRDKLEQILNALLTQDNDEKTPYSFFIEEKEVQKDLQSAVDSIGINDEKILRIIYQPQAIFKVKAITRCTSSLPGHAEAVLHASFSPDGQFLATGSGDTTVRFWDINTETPHHTCKGHNHWVLVTTWSPDGQRLASACKAGKICIWDPRTGKQLGKTMVGHKQWISAMCFEPLHLSSEKGSIILASAGKDGDVRLWNTVLGHCVRTLAGHTASVACLRWSGEGLIYSGSQDRTIKVWRASDGILCRTLMGHGHWVNSLALSTDYVLRTGAQDPKKLMKAVPEISQPNERVSLAKRRYEEALKIGGQERLVSGSDDFTLFMWEPQSNKKPVGRMTGHQQLINDVKFSPDTRLIASASFDKSIRLWSGIDGKFISVLRGHVAGVYQIAWSADSRLLLSGSKDSTLKVWNIFTRKLEIDLPGHADEVFAVDWSPDGTKAVSGGKDKVIKLWRR